ncbi:MAG: DUF4062 domain-containing protein [Bacteroidetes bacterium]|nr:DUF4062 domain-containing protein [Bacteroidota bacterium]
MTKKYQVFVSSTYLDLIVERNVVMQTLLEMDFIPCGMELFPAADDDQWTLIKRVIDECDYYIVIVGGRYGSLGAGNKSYTQLEYEYAVAQGKPVLAFLHENIGSLPKDRCEDRKDRQKKLNDFIELCQRKVIKHWATPQQLGSLVSTSLTKLVKTHPGIGWIRANEIGAVAQTPEIKAEEFFYTLDDKVNSNFPEIIKGAKSVKILARTAVNLVSQYERQFESLGEQGCEIKVLFISPDTEAAKYVYGTNPEIFEENIKKMNLYLTKLKKKIGTKFNSKCILHAPTLSLILIERENAEENFIIVQLYFLHSRVSRDRPLFKVYARDRWYGAFFDEFDKLWEGGL